MIGDIAHVCNRGVEKRKIFLDEKDYIRFVENLLLLNNKSGKLRVQKRNKLKNVHQILEGRDKLVEILKWTIMPNHYHLLLYEVREGGILEFTKRLGNAYTKYFNTKNHGRSGYLFQNSAKIIPITKDSQFSYIPVYIDLNSLDLFKSNWKEVKNLDLHEALHFLEKYRWSSFRDYTSESEFADVANKKLFYELFDTNFIRYEKELINFINEPMKKEI